MGCDIHGFCEVKENGVWKLNTKKVFKNEYYLSDGELKERQNDTPTYNRLEWQVDEFQEHPSDGRNYDWFAILANVRNGKGFAGVRTGEGFDVISEPLGVPDDATVEWVNTVNEWDCDMHSISYLYVDDFDTFDWSQTTKKLGIISIEQYKSIRGTNGTPTSWCGGVSGGNNITIDADAADMILDGKSVVAEIYDWTNSKHKSELVSLESDHTINVAYEWDVVYSEWFKHKIESIVNPMRKLKEEFEDVRYVFGFDN
jgi:hypothetical protein